MKKMLKCEDILARNLTALMASTLGLDTIDKVAQRSGVGRGTVDRIKKAEVSPKIETVEALAAAFGLTTLELLTDKEQAPVTTARPAASPARMQWVSDEEAQLLSDFRSTDKEGRDTMRKIGAMVPKIVAAGLAVDKPE